jgi:hypothetical protein
MEDHDESSAGSDGDQIRDLERRFAIRDLG